MTPVELGAPILTQGLHWVRDFQIYCLRRRQGKTGLLINRKFPGWVPSFQSFAYHQITPSQITQSAFTQRKKNWNVEIRILITLPISIKAKSDAVILRKFIRLYCDVLMYVTVDGHVL